MADAEEDRRPSARLVIPVMGQVGKIFCPGDCLTVIECRGEIAMLRARCGVCGVRWSRVRGTGQTNWGWIGNKIDGGERVRGQEEQEA